METEWKRKWNANGMEMESNEMEWNQISRRFIFHLNFVFIPVSLRSISFHFISNQDGNAVKMERNGNGMEMQVTFSVK